ncbi:hypothetical protein Lfee_2734 [Legionella feeleii]|uniref:Uncharacterized protein n=1 Tax=Legionella feeleii TaxID=453 RepID=A0A0W0THK7_9GAMM|nr:hypothetical protein Lfee_2734 [Legionella feeleii]SPX61712.1 Uncharacterised protein [Legionella feeleii]
MLFDSSWQNIILVHFLGKLKSMKINCQIFIASDFILLLARLCSAFVFGIENRLFSDL